MSLALRMASIPLMINRKRLRADRDPWPGGCRSGVMAMSSSPLGLQPLGLQPLGLPPPLPAPARLWGAGLTNLGGWWIADDGGWLLPSDWFPGEVCVPIRFASFYFAIAANQR